MQIEIKIDGACKEPKVVIIADKITDEINSLIKKIGNGSPQVLSGFRNGTLKVLEQPDILRVYTAAGKVFASTADGEYALRLRLNRKSVV